MRILQLSDFYPPIQGGLESVVQSTAEGLAARGHDVRVATLGFGDGGGTTQENGVTVHRLAGWNRFLARYYERSDRMFHPPFPDPGFRKGLREVLHEFQPDVVHAHSWSVQSALSLKGHPPVVLALHDYGSFCSKKTNVRNEKTCSSPALRTCLPCATAHYGAPKGLMLSCGTLSRIGALDRVARFLPVSRAVQEATLAATGLPASRFQVIPSFLPVPGNVSPAAPDESFGRLPPSGFLLYVGVLGRHKGVDLLLNVHEQIPDAPPLVLLGIPGDFHPPQRDGVVLLQNAPPAVVQEAWRRAALGIVPSRWAEPAPLVVLEAMRAGTPVVASSVGGMLDQVVDGGTGLLVPPGDAAALSKAITDLLRDPARLANMRRGASDRSVEYEASNVLDQLEGVYTEVLAADNPSSI